MVTAGTINEPWYRNRHLDGLVLRAGTNVPSGVQWSTAVDAPDRVRRDDGDAASEGVGDTPVSRSLDGASIEGSFTGRFRGAGSVGADLRSHGTRSTFGRARLLVHHAGTSQLQRNLMPDDQEALRGHRSIAPVDTAGSVTSFTISVVIPTKNEARNIGWVLERVGPIVDEIVIVDGLSRDGTVEAAIRVRPDAIIVRHEVAGKGEAVRAGFAAATCDLVVLLDADGSMDPDEIQRFVEELAGGSDFVKGSRFLPGGGTADITRLRSVGNAGLVRLANLLLGTSYTELCYGYMAFRRSRLVELDLRSSGFEIETEIVVKACRAGLTIREIPSFESPRRYGASNLNTFRDGWRVLRTLVRERFTPPVEIGPRSEVAS